MLYLKTIAFCLLFCALAVTASGQACTEIGQTPTSAFPVCGTKIFKQDKVPVCGINSIPGPVCNNPDDGNHMDMNPYWYKFTCYTAGTLGFTITPNELSDDYDWQVFDITGRNPNDVFTDINLFVTMNWSGESGVTGASSAGTSLSVCGGRNQPLFSKMANIQVGHEYLLLISHFSGSSQSGYQLAFGGGTAVITDPTIPELKLSGYNCGPYTIGLKLTKKVNCGSIAADGSDFAFTVAGPKITTATGVGCSSGFDTDSILLQLDKPLAPGVYTVVSQIGKDGNTVLDACGNAMRVGDQTTFNVLASPPVPMGSIKIPACGPDQLQLQFSAPIRCASISPDGKDFVLSGPSAVKITGASGNCSADGLTTVITLQLDKHITQEGNYTVTLTTGPDGNTIENECHVPTPPGGTAKFNIPHEPFVALGPVTPPACGPNAIQLVLADPVRCSSVAGDGSDFTITGPSAIVITSASSSCDASGMTKVITLQLKDRILKDGNYLVVLKAGKDGNTLLSECWQETPAGSQQPFTIAPQPAVVLGAMAPITCSPQSVKVGLSVPVQCNTIAPDGSDFTLTGPGGIQIIKAIGICNSNNLADSIELQLSAPILKAGDYHITLKAGTDGNTLLSECWQPAAINQVSNFRTADTVNASFSYTIQQDCRISTLHLQHDGQHAVNKWAWSFDDGDTYTTQNVVKTYTSLGMKHLQLTVSNGICTDTKSIDTLLRSEVTALFDVSPGPYCPMDLVLPENKSLGKIQAWTWYYGNGAITTGPQATRMQYFPTQKEQQYLIRLIVKNDANCLDTADHYITVVSSCYIDVPTAFSPNNDGQNDYLYPLNAYKAVDLHFAVYNRVGNLLFETTDWTHKWDGTVKGQPADLGTYVWMLEYTEKESGKRVFRKGTTVLVR
ncbi:gliding motility-associated C-terminal domain-containing protein [Chitinophaga eiseniae]|uniref:T9SS type B sorting domain-containing protein n=1 Tax=Chitinophaga eiseniae TaxID=634771 RepID=A0A847SVH7_9BACT|nr:gliding motility-associated C-terminal domain-containing protein [Chitinophaga eiseniae]NLR82126.1 T9SS type B sorting domain-containing protein [Chitinophaga eiseniae]